MGREKHVLLVLRDLEIEIKKTSELRLKIKRGSVDWLDVEKELRESAKKINDLTKEMTLAVPDKVFKQENNIAHNRFYNAKKEGKLLLNEYREVLDVPDNRKLFA